MVVCNPDLTRPIPFFTAKELACPLTGEIRLAPNFAALLVHLRVSFGLPMPGNSFCRSLEHNIAVDGHERSLHVYDEPYRDTHGCMAGDISTAKMIASQRDRLVKIARDQHWSIGHGANFLHLDARVALLGMERKEWGY